MSPCRSSWRRRPCSGWLIRTARRRRHAPAAQAGTVFCLSTISSLTPAELAAAAPDGRRWFQLYWSRDRGFTKSVVEAVVDSGFEAIVLTVDLPAGGQAGARSAPGLRSARGHPLPNLPEPLQGELQEALGWIVDPTITWRDLEWLVSLTDLPLVVKGVLTAEDAELACEHGATGIVVSNHGGRQLDGVPATLDALRRSSRPRAGAPRSSWTAASGAAPTSSRPLALGARAVLVGRPCSGASQSTGRRVSGASSSSFGTRSRSR